MAPDTAMTARVNIAKRIMFTMVEVESVYQLGPG